MPFPTLAAVTTHGVDTPRGTGAPSSTAFIHVCLAGVTLPSCREVTAAWLDTVPPVLPQWLAYCCSTGPGDTAGPLPARAAGMAKPGGGWPRAAAVGSPVDGPVGAAGSELPQVVRKGWYIRYTKVSTFVRLLGSPDGTHPVARPVDMLRATHCRHREPQQK